MVGLGLIGGSLAQLLHQRGVAVVGQDSDPATVAAAREVGLEATTDLSAAVAGADLVVLAVPLKAMRTVASRLAAVIDTTADATITDVGSVKASVRAVLQAAGLGGRFVGAHPMAGNEFSGFTASSPGLLDGATWAVTVPAGVETAGATAGDMAQHLSEGDFGFDGDAAAECCDVARLQGVVELLAGPLGGTVTVLPDDVHDAIVALISHVPHVLAMQLLNAVAVSPNPAMALGLAAGSFRDGTRVARTDPERTQAMVEQNAANVVPLLRAAVRDLDSLADQLAAGESTDQFFHLADSLRRAPVNT